MAWIGALMRTLAAERAPSASLVTCYCDLDPKTVPTEHELSSHVTSLLGELRDVAGRQAAGAVKQVEAYLGTLDRTGTHGVGLFASATDELLDLRLPGSVTEAVHVGRTYVLTPLLEFLERDRAVIVAAVGRDRGTLWQLRSGRIRELEDLSRDGQGQHDQGGWSQARYRRARDEEVRAHLQHVADELAERAPEGSDALLVVACAQDGRAAFEEMLAPHLQEALIGYAEVEKQDDAVALAPAAEELLNARLRNEREALLEHWREQDGQLSGRSSRDWDETIQAAWDGRVDTLLVGGDTEPAFECPQCGRGYPSPGSCALDGARLDEALGGSLEVAVRGTLLHGGDVRLAGPDELGAAGGAVALLRYPVRA
jgi:peptide chain release factor subunit 1